MPPLVLPPRTIPAEILHKIITYVFAKSIHSICVSTDDDQWEMKSLSTLRVVSFAFKAITTELAIKIFNVKNPEDNARIFPRVNNYLRNLRIIARGDPKHSLPYLKMPQDSGFIFGCLSFLAAMEMRSKTLQSPLETYKNTHDLVLSLLDKALSRCNTIEPPELTALLCSALKNERQLARHGLDIVQASAKIDTYLDGFTALEDSTADDVAQLRISCRTKIHEELEKLEQADVGYIEAMNSHRSLSVPGERVKSTLFLPGVRDMVNKFKAITFDVDEYRIGARMDSLCQWWLKSCPFNRSRLPSIHPADVEV